MSLTQLFYYFWCNIFKGWVLECFIVTLSKDHFKNLVTNQQKWHGGESNEDEDDTKIPVSHKN